MRAPTTPRRPPLPARPLAAVAVAPTIPSPPVFLKRGGKPRKPRYLILPRPTGPHDVDDLPSMYPTEDGEWEEEHIDYIGPVIEQYMADHSHRSQGTRYASETTINTFFTDTGLHENVKLQRIDRATCQKWKAILLNQPRKRPRQPVTIQMLLKGFSHFTRWLVAHDFFEKDPMHGLLLNARVVSDSKIPKEGFTDLELAMILKAIQPYRTSQKPDRVNFYWLCLCQITTGARTGEILHMRADRVVEIEGVWLFDLIPPEGKKKMKTKQSTRKVPLHPQLIDAGFLDYHATCSTPRLFPTFEGPGVPLMSRWFTDVLKELGIKRPAISSHSCRHTMVVRYMKAKVDSAVRHRLLGHALGTSIEETTYSRSLDFSIKELKGAVDSVTFPPLI